ncbi:cleavage protein [Halorhabdus tiamatea SARL4B]|uniref:Cleavage protein n=1 Tax=Halorhabdus tiamatea SARL4B TaxID=1033806 RepID=U2FGQ5_9EURY|nr:MBL fold metallo-hydrolase [Halorhabdus tiamatea]ERJ07409.1 cleavage protein [Halorhabdus tiamatea SARL4B]
MKVTYQHANPNYARESFLIRFHRNSVDQPVCILVDSGEGVNIDDLLDDDEYLTAVLLTHAHFDHYCTLGSNLRDSAPVYATPETAEAIKTRLNTALARDNLSQPDTIRNAIEPITDWENVTGGIRVRPVPSGHAPGASGFSIQFEHGDEKQYILATGDFTRRRAAGYPGIPSYIPADCVFLTGATSGDVEEQLTEAVATIVERTMAGSTVLATASGLDGVRLAYLLASISSVNEVSVPITVVGRVATLWDSLEYHHPAVKSVPEFDQPGEVLETGELTIAAPSTPQCGSSAALFGKIQNDANATLVQVTNGGFKPVKTAGCTVADFTLRNHPDMDTVDAVVEALQPFNVIITHQKGQKGRRFKNKYDSFLWSTEDDDQYTVYDSEWTGPSWVTQETRRHIQSHIESANAATSTLSESGEMVFPDVERHSDIDLEAEGLNLEKLAERIHVDTALLEDVSSFDPNEAGDIETSDNNTDEATKKAGGAQTTADEILDRLARIEEAVTGVDRTATVVDTRGDTVLLRVSDESLAGNLTHGQTLDVTVSGLIDSDYK